jgi:energy-coupling factor transporter ATP-binding protein EcfA2
MIKNLKVEGLNGKLDLDIEFNSDLNLFTGKNGAGKTTVLKLIWFLNGGYISHLISEINFQNIKLETEKAKIEISKKPIEKKRERASHLIYDMKVNEQSFSINEVELRQLDFRRPRYYEYLSNFRDASIPTIFFPTFRRIEGGFSMERNRYNEPMPVRTSVREALNELSERMSFPLHKFIASISTEDLIQLLTSEFAKTTEEFNRLQKKQSDIIIEKIKKRKGNDK